MLIVFSCGNCGRKYQKDVSLAGKKGRCKDCGHVFQIPRPSRMAPSGMTSATGRTNTNGDSATASPDRPRQQPRTTTRSPAPVQAIASVEDPYGLDDFPIAAAAPIAPRDDEEFAPPRRPVATWSKPKKKRPSGPNPGIPFFDGPPGFVYLIILGLLGLGSAMTMVSRDLGDTS